MANWIKMRCNLWDDSHVVSLRRLTGTSIAAVVGGLFRLWSVADDQTVDGKLPGYGLDDIDERVGIEGFGAALIEVGWLQLGDGFVVIPNFLEHNSASAKSRAQTAQRVSRYRAGGGRKKSKQDAVGEESPPPAAPPKPRAKPAPKPAPTEIDTRTDREVLVQLVQQLQRRNPKIVEDEYGFQTEFHRPSAGSAGLYEADTLVIPMSDLRKLKVV